MGRAGFDTRDFYGEEGRRAILECSGAAERAFFRAFAQGRKPPVKLVVGLVVLLSVGTVAGFVLALRGVSTERRHDVAVGTLWAVMTLSIVGYAFWKVVQFLERDAAKTEAEASRPADDKEHPSS